MIPPKFHLIPPKFYFSPTWGFLILHVSVFDSLRGDDMIPPKFHLAPT